MNETVQTLKTHGQELVAKGNQRRLVFRNKSGQEYFQTNLTVAIAVGLVVLMSGISIPFLIVGGAVATLAGVRVDYVNHTSSIEIDA